MVLPVESNVLCARLIGRDAYVAQFRRILQLAASGQGSAVAISGEAGVGKTRLTAELRALAEASEPRFDVASGACFEFDTSAAYAPIVDLLRGCMLAKTIEQIQACVGTDGPELLRILPELGEALPGVEAAQARDPEQDKRQLYGAISNVLLRLSATAPLVLVLEDVHWSDDASMEFLMHFVRKLSGAQLVLVLNFRGDEVQASLRRLLAQLERERKLVEWPLSRLTPDEIRDMLMTIFDLSAPPSKEFVRQIEDLTEGNPFFIEEVLKSLVASGEISRGRSLDRMSIADVPIPRSVQAAVQERTEALSPGAREIVTMAAIAGRRFDLRLLGAIFGHDEHELVAVVKELLAAQLVSEETADHFVFRHALTQQAIQSGLLARERRTLHARIGATLQSVYAEALDNHLPELAHHFFLAEQWDEAYYYCRRAAQRSLSVNAPRSATELLSRALQAVKNLGLTAPASVYRLRGQALEALGDFEGARSDYERAFDLATAAGDGRSEWQALIDLGFLWAGNEYEQSGAYFEQASELAERLDDDELRAKSLNRLGNWLVNVGRGDEAIPLHERALEIAERLEDRAAHAATLDLLGMAHGLHGNQPESLRRYRESIAMFRNLGDQRGLSTALAGASAWFSPQLSEAGHVAAWDEREAMDVAREAVAVAETQASVSGLMFAHMSACQVKTDTGRYCDAADHANVVLRLARETGHQQWLTAGEWELGVIAYCTFAVDDAIPQLRLALDLAQQLGSAWWIDNAAAYLARAHLQAGDPVGARTLIQPLLRAEPSPLRSRRMRLAWAETQLGLRELDPALATIDQLMATAPGVADGARMPVMRRVRGEILAAAGRHEDALAELRRAHEDAAVSGTLPIRWMSARALGSLLLTLRHADEAERHLADARDTIDRVAALNGEPDIAERFRAGALATLPQRRAVTANQAAKAQFGGLTAREREVATLIAQGKSNREIADHLVLGERTIETHVGNVLGKLGFSSRAQVAAWAVEVGLTRVSASPP